ncbi:NAD(+) diphosphatase [Paracoccaceae bacterium]|nr:NAD(+) diphosphatase [Paracoccaceae bacterium]
MLNKKLVTFGETFLDRSGIDRSDQMKISEYREHTSSKYLLYWRGKLPVKSDERDQLCWVNKDHPLVSDYNETLIFLGLDINIPIFSIDISSWMPEGYDPEAAKAFLDQNIYNHPAMPKKSHFAELRGFMNKISAQEAEISVIARGMHSWHQSNSFCSKCGHVSIPMHSGWQRDCSYCKISHFPRTDPVVIMLVTNGNNILLGRSHGWPERMYSCLAGFMEPGETVEAAVKREVFEETSVKVGAVNYLTSQPWPFPASLMIGCVAEATSTKILVDPKEIESAIWVSREEMLEVFSGNNQFMYPARKGSIAHFMIKKWMMGDIK